MNGLPLSTKYILKFSCPSFFPATCGHAEEADAAELRKKVDEKEKEEMDDEAVRIVNGWKAKPRPFMALIR